MTDANHWSELMKWDGESHPSGTCGFPKQKALDMILQTMGEEEVMEVELTKDEALALRKVAEYTLWERGQWLALQSASDKMKAQGVIIGPPYDDETHDENGES